MITTETVSIEKSTREAGKLLVDFVAKVRQALKAGGPILEAIAIGQAALVDLVPVLSQIETLKSEAKEDVAAEAQTVFLIAKDLYQVLK